MIADETADPHWVAADLLAQAEHDEDAYPLLITMDEPQAEQVMKALDEQISSLPRREIAAAACERGGHIFVAGDRVEAARVADQLAAEHLCLAVEDPEGLLSNIRV